MRALLEMAPEGSCVLSANSLSVRALDTFYVKQDKRLAVLCNRGQNGIDGTVSTAFEGVAQHFAQTTFLTGDFTMLHDLNALALQRELRVHHGGKDAPGIVVVLLNNNGGAIFDMLPQEFRTTPTSSACSWCRRTCGSRTPARAKAPDVPYRSAESVAAFRQAYGDAFGDSRHQPDRGEAAPRRRDRALRPVPVAVTERSFV